MGSNEVEQIAEGLNAEDFEIPADVPQPQLWRLLVAPVQPRKTSAGGIIMVEETQQNQQVLSYVGKVVACGPLVGKKPEWPAGAYDVKPGDWVVFGTYAGQRFQFKGLWLTLINDDEILAKADGPVGFKIYI